MSDEDKETDSERVEPLEVKSIEGVEGTVRICCSDGANNAKKHETD